ncbi:hypothetical protein GHT06_019690 [Daphnia sinensis]|uniref:Uncharacterized protein n=1 Tax=Daphnia sinensis TaxID=1820382 RepID=A0AAD5LB49_9CRUS|nr:hypothetical protein GHT06_019690 [Daphnia sinensis]
MNFSAFAVIAVLVCMALSIDAQRPAKPRLPKPTIPPQPSLAATLRSLPSRSSPSSNININTNENNNENFIFDSLFSELISNQNNQDSDPCDEDDDLCFWRMIGAGRLAKLPKSIVEKQAGVAASDGDAESVKVEKSSDDMERTERSRHPVRGSSNLNFNSNSNANSNDDFISLFASLQQFLKNQRKLTKKTSVAA